MTRLSLIAVLLPWVAGAQPLQLVHTIALPGVQGRIDHFSADVAGKRIFMAALGNNTVEVIDPVAAKVLHSIKGAAEPQGLFYWPEGNQLYVANAKSGKVRVFDGSSYSSLKEYDLNSDPDNLRFDPKEKEIFVGYGNGALGVINPKLGSRVGDTALDAHPESFQLEREGPRIFVNVPGADSVAVVDRRTRTVIGKWPVSARQNFPMALDEASHRLFIGCRKPAKLLVLDTSSGKQVAAIDIVADTDDLFYDSSLKRIYISGGGGAVTVINQVDADHYALNTTIPTGAGARTSYFVPDLKQLYVAVPHRGKQAAALLVFATQR